VVVRNAEGGGVAASVTVVPFCLQEVQPVEVQHVKREANQAAHLLAKYGLCLLNDCTWLGECPSPIQDIVAFEQAIIIV